MHNRVIVILHLFDQVLENAHTYEKDDAIILQIWISEVFFSDGIVAKFKVIGMNLFTKWMV